MKEEKGFDLSGLFFTVNELNKAFEMPLPNGLEDAGFCHFCLGANYSGNVEQKAQWCCGSWVDGLLPLLKICERFKADKKRVKEIAKRIRPTADSSMSSFNAHPVTEVSLGAGITIKVPAV